MVFVIIRLIYVEFRVLWKGKEKSKTGGVGGLKKKGLLPNLASLS